MVEQHPIVAAFIKTDKSFHEICVEWPDADNPVAEALRQLSRAIGKEAPVAEAVDRAQSVSLAGRDPCLSVLMLIAWIVASTADGRFAEASGVLNRARAIMPDDAPMEIRAALAHAGGILARAIGNKDRSAELFRESLDLLPSDSPRRGAFLSNYAVLLAQWWREQEVDAQVEEQVRRRSPGGRGQASMPRFVQYAETGRAQEALAILDIIQADAVAVKIHQIQLRWYRQMLGLMQAGSAIPGEEDPLVLPCRHLLERHPEEALKLLRAGLLDHLDGLLAASALPSFNLVRVELGCGHGPAARRVLDARAQRGNTHPLDDFFLARVELLAGNRELAAVLFQRALATAEKYGAQGRLDFELRMACELSPADVLWLTRAPVAAEARPSVPGAAAPGTELGAEERLLGDSEAMETVRQAVRRFAPLDAPVLITGETGTGKELVARALHEEGARSAQPFVAVNCGAIAESLLETELFGHERGAFTGAARAHRGFFEQAGTGTVFLDEIGEVTPRLQAALLRVLESGDIRPVGGSKSRRVGCRILAATNAPLERLVTEGSFRQDLLYRLKRLEIRIPPLRERRGDILTLADHFLCSGRADDGRPVMSDGLRDALRQRDWPGNVRELRNVIERMRLLGSEKLSYETSDLEAEAAAASPQAVISPAGGAEGRQPEADAPGPAAGPGASEGVESPEAMVARVLASSRSPLRRRERLKKAFLCSPTLTRQEVLRILEVSDVTATHDLAALIAEGFIEKVKPSASPRSHYFRLRPASPQAT